MNKKEFGIFTAALQTFYPRERLLPNMQAIELWYSELCDIPYITAETALKKWVAINKWPPTIADIREQAVIVQTGEIPLWSDGWEECRKVISKYGRYGADKAMAELTGITKETVQRLGFSALCRSENTAADRANFRTIFEQLAQRKQKALQLSEKLTQLIGDIQERGQLDEGKRLPESDQENQQFD